MRSQSEVAGGYVSDISVRPRELLLDIDDFVVHDLSNFVAMCAINEIKKYRYYTSWNSLLDDLLDIHDREKERTKRLRDCEFCMVKTKKRGNNIRKSQVREAG
jgi:hypothetical protein